MPVATLLYDETCGFCTRVVNWVSSKDERGEIAIMPCQFAMVTGRFPVTEQQCLSSIQLYDSDFRASTKGRAVTKVLGLLLNSRWPERIGGLPVISYALDLAYTFIAVNRHRIPVIKQMCTAGDQDGCGTA